MFFKTQHKNYGLTALRAKGRMKKGELNRTETSYAQYLEGEKQSGRVADYWETPLRRQRKVGLNEGRVADVGNTSA